MAGLPCLVRPMLATLRHRLPADQDRYGWEFKWDGVRTIAYVSGHQVRLLSRNNKDMTASYPELAVLADRVHAPVIVDGEIAALRAGRPDFAVLQSRMHVRHPAARLIDTIPVQLYVFDLLYVGDQPLLGMPYTERRARLDDLGLDVDPVLGGYDGARLRYAGNVGTGFTDTMLAGLMRLLAPFERETSPFSTPAPPRHTCGTRWVEPRLAGEVAFTERISDGSLRHASWRGLRNDKDPGHVHPETG